MDDRFAGKAEWFDEHYATTRGRVRLDLVLERLRGVVGPKPIAILDAGGGTGAFAIPLAKLGHEVTVLDQSPEWLERAGSNAEAAGVRINLRHGTLDGLTATGTERFDMILCHAVLMYVPAPTIALRALRSVAAPGCILSLIDKNSDGIALRPGLDGDYGEARRLLRERGSVGRLGIPNQAYALAEWMRMLTDAGWTPRDWVGIRLFSDHAPDDLTAEAYGALVDLERDAGRIDPYRQMSRLVHILAIAGPEVGG